MGHILIIDDDGLIRELLKRYFSEMGYHVTAAKNGKDGIDLLKACGTFDAVITDIEMPVLDGNGVASFIRTSTKPRIPILAITGSGSSGFQENLFDMVFPKPFVLKKLGAAVETFMLGITKQEVRP